MSFAGNLLPFFLTRIPPDRFASLTQRLSPSKLSIPWTEYLPLNEIATPNLISFIYCASCIKKVLKVGTDLSVPCALLCTKHEQVRAYNSRFSTGNSVIRRISL